MFSHIHLSKRTNITNTHNVDSKITKEIDNIQSFVSNTKTQQEWRHQGTHKLLQHENLKQTLQNNNYHCA